MIDLFLENLAHDVFHIFGESGVQIFCLFAHSYIELVSRTRLKSVWSINGKKQEPISLQMKPAQNNPISRLLKAFLKDNLPAVQVLMLSKVQIELFLMRRQFSQILSFTKMLIKLSKSRENVAQLKFDSSMSNYWIAVIFFPIQQKTNSFKKQQRDFNCYWD